MKQAKFNPVFDALPGQIREFKDGRRVFIYGTEGFRADVLYASGMRDSVFAGWLCEVTQIVSELS